MPPVVIPGAAQVTVSGDNAGATWANVMHVGISGFGVMDEAEAESISDIFFAYYDNIKVRRTTIWSANTCRVMDIRSATGPAFTFDNPTAGTATDHAMPSDTAAVVSLRNGEGRGGRYRGRVYLGGYTEAANDNDGRIAASTIITELTDFGTFRGNLSGNSTPLGIGSRTYGELWPVQSHTMNTIWDRQRRRRQRS